MVHQEELLKLVSENPNFTIAELTDLYGLEKSDRTSLRINITNRMRQLLKWKLVERVPDTYPPRWRVVK